MIVNWLAGNAREFTHANVLAKPDRQHIYL